MPITRSFNIRQPITLAYPVRFVIGVTTTPPDPRCRLLRTIRLAPVVT
ncbi:MAG TPA: hypothetical protein VIX17_29120 [Pyrinomonadaceae bacterium]